MATRHVMIGTGLALTGIAGVGIAAVGSGASDQVTPLQPAADTFTTTHTQTIEDRTAARPAKRVRVKRHDDGRIEIRHAKQTTTTTRGAADDGPNHDLNDNRGGRGEVEAGDDRGGRGEVEAGDDHGGNSSDDSGHGSDNRGRGGGDDD